MNEVVYLDVYFLLNLIADAVILAMTSFICGEKTTPLRLFSAAFLGAFFSAATLFISLGDWMVLFGGVMFLPVMIWVAFGKKRKRFWILNLFSFLTALFLGGTLGFLSYYAPEYRKETVTLGSFCIAIGIGFGAWCLWGKSLRRRIHTLVIPVSICYNGKREELFGLVDSGALLRDGEGTPVMILKAEYASGLLTEEEMEELRRGWGKGIRSIPVRTASGAGTLSAFLPQSVYFHRVGKRRQTKISKQILVALDFTEGGFGGCPCLIPLCAL